MKPRNKSRLGRGLNALIPFGETALTESSVAQVPVADIVPNPRQPRVNFDPGALTELANSIRTHGVIQPLVLTRGETHNQYTIIVGERRLQAARKIGLQTVPAIIREVSEQEILEMALVENVQRTDLSPLETAKAYRQLAEDFGLSQEVIAHRVGKSRVSISNTIRLLKLSKSVLRALSEEKITEGHARSLLALPTAKSQATSLKHIIEDSLTVRQTEAMVRKSVGRKRTPASRPADSQEINALEERLRMHLGTKVTLNHKHTGGTLVIHYYSKEELNVLVYRIIGGAG